MKNKVMMNISATVYSLDDIKGLLPQIAALQKNYDVDLTISYLDPARDQSFLQSFLEEKHSPEQQ